MRTTSLLLKLKWPTSLAVLAGTYRRTYVRDIYMSRNRTVGASIGEAPCSRVHLAYSLRQLRVGISPPYALNPYDRLRNVL